MSASDQSSSHDHEVDGGFDFGHELLSAMGADDTSLNSLRPTYKFVSSSIPSKLRLFFASNKTNISSKIFQDMVIRYPVVGSPKEDVEELLRPFGPFEYLNRAGGKGQCCHTVRFESYEDAVKCYLLLNGSVIDAEARDTAIAEWRQVVEDEFRKGALSSWNDEETETPARDLLNTLGMGEDALRIRPLEEEDRLVVVTCDFFRSAFADPLSPKMSLLGRQQKKVVGASFPNFLERLEDSSREFMSMWGPVKTYELQWESFAFCANYLTFFNGSKVQKKQRHLHSVLAHLRNQSGDVANCLAFMDTLPQQRGPSLTDGFVVGNRVVAIGAGCALVGFIVLLFVLMYV